MQALSRRKDNAEQEHEDVKPKLEDIDANIPNLDPPTFKFGEEDVKPKLEPVDSALPLEDSESPKTPKHPAPEIIDLTVDEVDEPPPAGHSSPSPVVEPPSSSALSSQNSTRVVDYSVFADDEEQADLFELLDCLTTSELEDLAKQLKLKRTGVKRVSKPNALNHHVADSLTSLILSQRDNLIDAILRGSATQSTLWFPKSKGKEPMVQTKLHLGTKHPEKSMHQSMLPFKPTPESQRTQQDRVRAIVTKKLST